MKGSFSSDLTLSPRLFALLGVAFPEVGISQAAQHARALGIAWESVSTPFVHIAGDRVISHVGVIEIPFRSRWSLISENFIIGYGQTKLDHRTLVHFTLRPLRRVILSVAKNLSESPFIVTQGDNSTVPIFCGLI